MVVTDVSTGIEARIQIAQYEAWCVEFLKHFTDLSWVILSGFFFYYFFRLFSVTFLLCRAVTAGSDSRDGTEGGDDMQQRSRGKDMSHTSTNCQDALFMLISMLKIRQQTFCIIIPYKVSIQFDLYCLYCGPVSFSNL